MGGRAADSTPLFAGLDLRDRCGMDCEVLFKYPLARSAMLASKLACQSLAEACSVTNLSCSVLKADMSEGDAPLSVNTRSLKRVRLVEGGRSDGCRTSTPTTGVALPSGRVIMAPVQVAEAEYSPACGVVCLGGGIRPWLVDEDCLTVGVSKGGAPVVMGGLFVRGADLRPMIELTGPIHPRYVVPVLELP